MPLTPVLQLRREQSPKDFPLLQFTPSMVLLGSRAVGIETPESDYDYALPEGEFGILKKEVAFKGLLPKVAFPEGERWSASLSFYGGRPHGWHCFKAFPEATLAEIARRYIAVLEKTSRFERRRLRARLGKKEFWRELGCLEDEAPPFWHRRPYFPVWSGAGHPLPPLPARDGERPV